MASLYYNLQQAAIELRTGIWTLEWGRWIQLLFAQVDTLTTAVNALPGVNVKTYTELNALGLGVADEGYLAFEPNYGHFLRWTGTVWQFAPGDPGNGYFEDFAIAPQQVGWALCDGSATDYLTVGAVSLSVTAITPPNLSGYYRKGAGSYTGTLVAGSTSGETDDVGDSGGSGQMDIFGAGVTAGVDFTAVYTSSTFIHRHGAGSLDPDPAHLGVLMYFRR